MRNYRIAIALTWTLLMLLGCWLPSSWLPHRLPTSGLGYLGLPKDKLIHTIMFLGFAVLWIWALGAKRSLLLVAVSGIVLTILTELGQSLPFINRDGDLPDALADSLGLALGMLLAWLLLLRHRDEASPGIINGGFEPAVDGEA